jgi:multidrug efflux pump subunit AcrA (membrane-fusion protein)
VYPEAAIGGEFESTVTIVDPVLDAASGTFRVRLTLPNPDYQLTSGLKCSVRFLDQVTPASASQQVQERPTEIAGKVAVKPKPSDK